MTVAEAEALEKEANARLSKDQSQSRSCRQSLGKCGAVISQHSLDLAATGIRLTNESPIFNPESVEYGKLALEGNGDGQWTRHGLERTR